MVDEWEIVEGDFGGAYKAIAEDLDLSACTAKVKVWKGDTILIDGKACGSITYADGDSYCYYTVADGDFPLGSAIDGKRTNYRVMVEFTKEGYKEHDLGFEWIVIPAPPSS